MTTGCQYSGWVLAGNGIEGKYKMGADICGESAAYAPKKICDPDLLLSRGYPTNRYPIKRYKLCFIHINNLFDFRKIENIIFENIQGASTEYPGYKLRVKL